VTANQILYDAQEPKYFERFRKKSSDRKEEEWETEKDYNQTMKEK
jgi:hypothetical protein